jgi:NAD(P)H-hydrate epimerase
VDIPSGVNSDTGLVCGTAVKADLTLTFSYPKIGIMLYPGAEYAGTIRIADISIPISPSVQAGIIHTTLADGEIPELLPPRKARSNKGTFGHVLGFAGSAGMPGAAIMSASAAYRTGAGYVCACTTPSVAKILQHGAHEVVTRIVPDHNGALCPESLTAVEDELERATVVYVGPGLSRGKEVSSFVFALLEAVKVPIVIDADALNAISEDITVLKKLHAPCVITPHPGEMSRLTGLSVDEILAGTIETASAFAREFNVVTVLKDARTIVANPNGHSYINNSGTSALAKAGTGDVLTGIITGFIAQGMDVYEAAALGVYIHGKAGENAEKTLSQYGVTATDVLEHIPRVLNSY